MTENPDQADSDYTTPQQQRKETGLLTRLPHNL